MGECDMKFTMSTESACLPEQQLREVSQLPKKRVRLLVVNAEPSLRYVSAVEIDGREFWADRATGTLYRQDNGRCMGSSMLQLDLSSLK